MNTLFIDVYNKNNQQKNENKDNESKYRLSKKTFNIKSNILKYELIEDILKNSITNNISLKLDETSLDKIINTNKLISIRKMYFENNLMAKLKKVDKINVVFSKFFDRQENVSYKKYILTTLSKRTNLKVKEIVSNNNMNINDIAYIDDYVKDNKIPLNKLRILIAINDIEDFCEDKVKEYILKYKFVDILRLSDIDKYHYNILQNKVEKINNEFGSTIEITQKRNIQEYNVYVLYSKVDIERFKDRYILNKNSRIIDINDEEQDVYNVNLKEYIKNKYDVETLFNRIDLNDSSFSKNKLGALILEDRELSLDK